VIIGPVLLEQSADLLVYHRTVNKTLASELPWHVLYTHPHQHYTNKTGRGQTRVQHQDGNGGARYWPGTNSIVMSGVPDHRIPKIFAHELGHALDHLLFTDDDQRDELHALLHRGSLPQNCNDGHWYMRTWDMWTHSDAPGEAVAWAVSYLAGMTRITNYGPHSWDGVWAERIRDLFWQQAKGIQVFNDVPADHTHADAIHRLAAMGIVGGFPDGTFKPSDPVTRGQLATIISRVLDADKG
jgi:hypothetical protein